MHLLAQRAPSGHPLVHGSRIRTPPHIAGQSTRRHTLGWTPLHPRGCYPRINATGQAYNTRRRMMVTRLSGSDQQTLSRAPADLRVALGSYHVELPQALLDADEQLLDWVIAFAFDTLD